MGGRMEQGQGKYKLYPGYSKVMSGDDIGCMVQLRWYEAGETVEVSMAISYVSEEGSCAILRQNSLLALHSMISAPRHAVCGTTICRVYLSKECSLRDKVVFYTGLYHALIHPNILQDVDGAYPVMESDSIAYVPEGHNRYTVFSLWDTYRNLHQLLTLVYPERQTDMLNTMRLPCIVSMAGCQSGNCMAARHILWRATRRYRLSPIRISVVCADLTPTSRGRLCCAGATAPGPRTLCAPMLTTTSAWDMCLCASSTTTR